MKKIINVIFSIIFSVLIIITIVKFTVGFKQLYYFDIDYLNIPMLSGLSKEEIKENYDYTIDYNLSKENKEFELPTLKSSKQGKIHFEEVRDIFQNMNKIFNISLVLSIIGVIINILNKNIEILKTTSKTLILLPMILMLPVVINFEGSFVLFHKIMFNNDYWIFDPNLDPVINILPEKFFFHAGIMILILVIVASLANYLIYKLLKREQ
ncbi:TIGR01906 family membrane protein [Romboutsia sp. 13368]|uniref:TIGR01906 family membrane protein n=1 Tax=Romboutsia sp. 13368 TaxID=2708053 RepID=UPI0025F0F86E|nr:TIGR01906 family membrane protein [Romboutsia sp. 13368]